MLDSAKSVVVTIKVAVEVYPDGVLTGMRRKHKPLVMREGTAKTLAEIAEVLDAEIDNLGKAAGKEAADGK